MQQQSCILYPTLPTTHPFRTLDYFYLATVTCRSATFSIVQNIANSHVHVLQQSRHPTLRSSYTSSGQAPGLQRLPWGFQPLEMKISPFSLCINSRNEGWVGSFKATSAMEYQSCQDSKIATNTPSPNRYSLINLASKLSTILL